MPEPIPVIRLGQLAVDTGYLVRHFGSDLLVDATRRAHAASASTAIECVCGSAPDAPSPPAASVGCRCDTHPLDLDRPERKDGTTTMNDQQLEKIRGRDGFIAALDQSGGSTPKALRLYGIDENAWDGDDEMFSIIHEMRTRIVTSPSFGGDRILGAILFENTMDREIEGKPSARYLWDEKNVVPFLKVDKGLAAEADGVQVMKPMPELDSLLARAKENGVFGTKMRSLIKLANPAGVKAVVDQQFEIGRRIADAGLVPIIEPEIDIHSPEKEQAEVLLKEAMLAHLDALGPDRKVMLKLTLPERENFYAECVNHPNVLRVAALSGGYTREEANARMTRHNGVIASFSRALTEGLTAQQTDEEFNAMLDGSIATIYDASTT